MSISVVLEEVLFHIVIRLPTLNTSVLFLQGTVDSSESPRSASLHFLVFFTEVLSASYCSTAVFWVSLFSFLNVRLTVIAKEKTFQIL